MIVFLNGKFVPEEQAVVSIFDRGFLYGDGLFEAIRIRAGKPFRWTQHLQRLRQGADLLKLKLPFSSEDLLKLRAGTLGKKPHARSHPSSLRITRDRRTRLFTQRREQSILRHGALSSANY